MDAQTVTVQGWLPFQSRSLGEPKAVSLDVFRVSPADLDSDPEDQLKMDHLLLLSNHPTLQAVAFKIVAKNSFQTKRWLKGKELVLMVVNK